MGEVQRDATKKEHSRSCPTLRKTKKVCLTFLRGCFRPGFLALLAVSVPHVLVAIVDDLSIWVSFCDYVSFLDMTLVRKLQSVAVLGAIGYLMALRAALRPRKPTERSWGFDRILAVIALLIFAASIFNSNVRRQVYYSFSQEEGAHKTSEAEAVHYRFYWILEGLETFAYEHPEGYFPELRRMGKHSPPKLSAFRERYDPSSMPGGPQIRLSTGTDGLPLLVCRNERIFYYLGYKVRNEDDVQAYAQAYREALADPERGEFLKLDPSEHARLGTYPIPSSVPGLFLPSWGSWSGIPVLIEQIDPETATHGEVLFGYGHSERIPYPGHWPMTEKTMKTLQELADESLQMAGEE